MPLVREKAAEHPIGLSDSKKASQLSIPIPIPTA
jgi:hypothetical protein